MTLTALQQRLGEPESRLRYSLNAMKDDSRVHITGWEKLEKNYVQWIPVWAFGKGRNVPPPESPHTTMKQHNEVHPLDFNPGADLQQVTLTWGHMTMRGE